MVFPTIGPSTITTSFFSLPFFCDLLVALASLFVGPSFFSDLLRKLNFNFNYYQNRIFFFSNATKIQESDLCWEKIASEDGTSSGFSVHEQINGCEPERSSSKMDQQYEPLIQLLQRTSFASKIRYLQRKDQQTNFELSH
jgi:hypothetical protein